MADNARGNIIRDFRRMSFYQIWIRSFADGNGDGIGDLLGVYDKLDYIKSLGVDGIWFSPIYPSPNADYGYDISDYYNIHPDYGDLELFKKVLDAAHKKGLKVLMDLVVNHTSDEHEWFLESKKSKDNKYSDYYIWKDPKIVKGKKVPPNNWDSLFEGKAWDYVPERDQYYLHIFARKQPDLNMDNPVVRNEVKKIMRFWLSMGVDGFREDVITFISKHPDLPDGYPFIPVANGMPFYKDGPRIQEYLREFRDVCLEYGALQIGEAPMTTVETALSYITGKDRTLDMMFHFDHMMADCFLTEYIHRDFDLVKLKKAFSKWQTRLLGKGWNALYMENHDHPRVISRYGNEKKYWRESGTALAASYLFQQGTPFIYQGQEIGMTNIRLSSIDKYIDVSSHNNYNNFHTNEPVAKRLKRIQVSSRDSSRTPMQWNSGKYAGFSTVKPWFYLNHNYKTVNVQTQDEDPYSILNFYRKCLSLRKENEGLIYGRYREYFHFSKKLYVYGRRWKEERYLIIISFSENKEKIKVPKGFDLYDAKLLISNYNDTNSIDYYSELRPYEVRVFRKDAPKAQQPDCE
ncbi:MAG: alpha-glucosidase [Butyrivibrio sp.]|uniref:alpha-glucosidase n=1 Tax=Butyrivibrio sp. TaxID=28121 RepID=UPI0025E7D1F1|nr:alpha-glucosidase [Butyrivibrio sp.]MCR5771856.1 alpha-glucosidase [Butyrivibrio sp.]